MSSSSGQPNRLVTDVGLPAGLLLAMLIVILIDRGTAPPVEAATGVDLVFILDQSNDMRGLITAVKSNCVEKARSLSGGLDCRFAVIPFGGARNRIAHLPFTSDLDQFEEQLTAKPDASAEVEVAATSSEALVRALRLEFREDVPPLFYVISKAPCSAPAEVSEVAREMAARGVTTIVQADASARDNSLPLYQSGGKFYSMEGEDLTPVVASSETTKNSARAASLLAALAPESSAESTSSLVQVQGIFALRTAQNREQLVLELGGTPESEMAVKRGLNWLARHQSDEGWWSDREKCEESRCSSLTFHDGEVPETGLAILAFQAGGHYYFNDQEYSEPVKRGLDWLITKQAQDGSFFTGTSGHSTWYHHGIATFAVAEACAVALANNEDPDPRYLSAAERAVKFIEEHQYARGGWRYTTDSESLGDTSVTGWVMLGLKSGEEAGIEVSAQTMAKLSEFFELVSDPATGRTGYQGKGGGSDLTTAVGLVFQEFLLKQPDSELARNAVEYLKLRASTKIGQGGDFYTLYNSTLAMFLARGEAWEHWNNLVRDAVVARQETEGCAAGSWNQNYSRTLSTAWAVLTLEVYYRYAAEDE